MKDFCPKCMKWNIDFHNIEVDPLEREGFKYHCTICKFRWAEDLMKKTKRMMKMVIRQTHGKHVSEEEMLWCENFRKELAKKTGMQINE